MAIIEDDKGRVSFAVVAVLILIMGSFSAVYITSVNLHSTQISHQERMTNIAALVHNEVDTQAYHRAQSAVYTATQVYDNQSKIMPLFNDSFEKYINEHFPKIEGNLKVEITNHTLGIFFEAMNVIDIVPTNEQENVTLRGVGKEVESKTIDNHCAGVKNQTSTLIFYSLSGEINYTIYHIKSTRFLKKSMMIDQRIESSFPFINSKMEILKASSTGSLSPIPRTVKYILTTIAQWRVLQGYGMGSISDLVLDIPEKETREILTKYDVELAMNLALLLETARLFRGYDQDTLREIDEDVNRWKYYEISGDTSLQDLVLAYVTEGTVDAADIIALYLGIDKQSIHLSAIISQALNSIADQFVLKYLDYFHLMDVYDAALSGVQFLVDAIEWATSSADDLFGFLSGESVEEDNLGRMLEWVEKTLTKEGGMKDTTIVHDTTVLVDLHNYTYGLSKSGECQHLEDHDNNASTPNILVTHSWTAQYNYELVIPDDIYEVDFKTKNILRDDVKHLWYDPNTGSDFYDEKFGISVNEIYKGVRHVVKLICSEVVALLDDMQDLNLTQFTRFSLPQNLNPKDEVSLLEEVKIKVFLAMEAIEDYFTGPRGRTRLKVFISQLVDEHSKSIGALQDFVVNNYDDLAEKDSNLDPALKKLTSYMISNSQVILTGESTRGEHPECAPSHPFSQNEVRVKFQNSHFSDVKEDMESYVIEAYNNVKTKELSTEYNGRSQEPIYILGALQNALEKKEDVIIDLLVNQVHGFGFIPMGCGMVKLVAGDLIYGGEIVNTKFLQYSMVGIPLEFWEDEYNGESMDKKIVTEKIQVDQEPNYLKSERDLRIKLSKPKGTHYTEVGGVDIITASAFGNAEEDLMGAVEDLQNSYKLRPFETRWEVSVGGKVKIMAQSENHLFLVEGGSEKTRCIRDYKLDLSISIVVYSGWNLEGVNYELSDTLLEDILEFLNKVWDYIVSVVGAVFDVLTKLMESFVDLLTKMISYIAELVKLIVDTIQFLVELIRDFIQTIMDTIVKNLIEAISNVIENGITISVFGWTFAIKGNRTNAQNQSADGDLLCVQTKGSAFNIDINFTVKFVRYHKEDDDEPHYDILIDSHFKVGDFLLDLTVDPLMAIQSYIIEGHGKSEPENGGGWGIDIYSPEIEEYKEVKYCLSDVMGGMNSIPIPFLGLKATVDCGFIIHYNAPKGTDVVINEFELNPPGYDGGYEWFELYDPQEMIEDDWRISSHAKGLWKVPIASLESVNDGVYRVYNLSYEVLQNGKRTEPFAAGDGLILYDGQGNVIDRTPKFKDPGKGDSKTWQRSYDGGAIWKLKEETKLIQNGPEKLDMKQEIKDALKSSFQVAWSDFIEKDISLDAIIDLIKDWIHNFIEMVLTLIKDAVYRVFVYLDFALEDATGSAGGGIRLSLGMDVEGVDILLRWIIDTIETFVHNILNPGNCEDIPSIPKKLSEHMFIRFELYFKVGTPNIIKKVTKDPPPKCRFSIAIQANIPALVNLLGWDWGDWEVVFGVYLDHFPSRALSSTFGTSDDESTYVDFWLFRVRIYEIS